MENKNFLSRFQILSGSMLKIIAIVAMFLDHAAVALHYQLPVLDDTLFHLGVINVTPYYILRAIGRLAFPIFCFLIAEGIVHTRDVRKYAGRLLVFAVISEMFFDLLLAYNTVCFEPSFLDTLLAKPYILFSRQNTLFTLFFGVVLVYIYERMDKQWLKWLCMVGLVVAAQGLCLDYGAFGVLLVFVMYLFREQAAAKTVLAYPLLGKLTAMASFVPILMYNGQRGFGKSRFWKYAFYVFYPLHMLVLVGVAFLLNSLDIFWI